MDSTDPSDQARLIAQARLIEAYELNRWPRRVPTLPELLSYLMDQHGLTRTDLAELLGTASRVSEVMTGKRELSMSMVRKLRDRFHAVERVDRCVKRQFFKQAAGCTRAWQLRRNFLCAYRPYLRLPLIVACRVSYLRL